MVSLPSAGSAQEIVDLFGAAPALARAAPATTPGAVRQRVITLDLGALERVVPRGIDKAANRLYRAARLRGRVRIELFPEVAGTFRRKSVEEAQSAGYIWIGDEESGGGTSTLVIKGGQVTGHLDLKGRVFRIEPIAGTAHSVIEIDVDSLRPDAPHQRPARSGAKRKARAAQPPVADSPATSTPVDLLVAYTKKADDAKGDINAEIDLAVSLTNQAFSNSGVKVRLKLVRALLAPAYNEDAYSYTATLYNVTGVEGGGSTTTSRLLLDPVRRQREVLGADLVALVREGGSYCGQGWVIEKPTEYTSGYGFAQISRGCIPGYALAHEFGHTMGLNHDRYVEPKEGNSSFNYGFVNLKKRIRDIMSYTDHCRDRGFTCTLKNYFSNPLKSVAGMPFGIAQGRPGAADGSRTLNDTRAAISSYRTPVAPRERETSGRTAAAAH